MLEVEAQLPSKVPDQPNDKESDADLEYEEIENTNSYIYTIKVEDPNKAKE
jgi:hypothetical protein